MIPTDLEAALYVLRRVRQTLGRPYAAYLCYALRELDLDEAGALAAEELVAYIQTTLRNEPHFLPMADLDTVVLEDCLPEPWKSQVGMNPNWAWLTRAAWLDAMIRDLEANGALP